MKAIKTNRGFTLIELIVSIALISIVLVFVMQMFLSVRNVYANERANLEYELTRSVIIDAVMKDQENYKFTGLSPTSSSGSTSVTLYFSGISSRILRVNTTSKTITYGSIVRKLPDDAILGNMKVKALYGSELYEIQIPLSDAKGNTFNINIDCLRK